jgi:hypothetical protein
VAIACVFARAQARKLDADMKKSTYAAVAFIVGAVLGGGFGSMIGGHVVGGISIGGAAGLAVAWLVLLREYHA